MHTLPERPVTLRQPATEQPDGSFVELEQVLAAIVARLAHLPQADVQSQPSTKKAA